MAQGFLYRLAGASALAAMLATSTPVARFAEAAPAKGLDGEPTPAACRGVGVELTSYGEQDYGSVNKPTVYGKSKPPQARAPQPMPPPPPPPAPPPPPPPPPPPAMAPPVVANGNPGVIGGAPAPGHVAQAQDTERYPNAAVNPVKQVAAEPVSTFSIDVDTASYTNTRRFLTEGRRPPPEAVRVEELVNYFDYDYPRPASAAEPFRPFLAVTPSPWAKARKVVHIGLQGYKIPRQELPPLNLVFLVDTSGSMSPEDRLPLAVRSLNVLIGHLRPQDHVAIVAYAGSAGQVLAPTDGTQKLKMRCALQALHSGGSTAGGEGISLAYDLATRNFQKGAVNRVILMTDGDFNVGVSDPGRLKDFVAQKRDTGVYLSVYGFGRGNYNDEMMQALAQNGNGIASYVDSPKAAERLFSHDFAGANFTIANDVKIQVEFNPAQVAEYRLIGYETRLLNREDFNNDRVDAGEVGSGVSVTALYEITPVGAKGAVDPLRYQNGAQPPAAGSGELAYLKIRYKLPGQSESKLMQRAIGPADVCASLAAAPEQTRWALAVAGYGQRLRNDPWIDPGFGWNDIAALAAGARDYDPSGERSEFLGLVKTASRLPPAA